MYKIILIEDEVTTGEMLVEHLKYAGYNTVLINTPEDILDLCSGKSSFNKADLYIIDVHVHSLSGLEITNKLNEIYKNINVLFISGDDGEETMCKAYEIGCYDYLRKPFKIHELLLKVNRFFKFTNDPSKTENRLKKICENATYNISTKELVVDYCKPIELTNQEEKLFDILISNPNTYFSIEKLENLIWGELVGNAYVRHLVSRLRKKLPCDAIKNKIGKGYKIVEHNG